MVRSPDFFAAVDLAEQLPPLPCVAASAVLLDSLHLNISERRLRTAFLMWWLSGSTGSGKAYLETCASARKSISSQKRCILRWCEKLMQKVFLSGLDHARTPGTSSLEGDIFCIGCAGLPAEIGFIR